ncbi:RHS repeat-associated core domain-containing protein, partial [Flavobacterium amniphilum]|uniref:RHS repeat-associated core domain-containing protein n=1 Tax=Flavobacterium amniphilum TaxID=1834035 RepID=UPI002029FDAC
DGLISTDLGSKDDLFAFKITYNNPSDNSKALFNGNISETQWRTLYDDQQRKYTYTYDHLNRLLQADYSRPDNTSVVNAYKEVVNYDKNGNITDLERSGMVEAIDYEYPIDNLTYVYDTNNKNRLLKVSDSSEISEGFTENMDPNGNSNDDYSYDANGNMIRDDNKAITNITYNHLNLPFVITFYNPHGKQTKIEYIYDAAGSKKGKKVHYYEPDYSGGGGSEMKGVAANSNAAPVNSSVGPTTYVQKMTRTDYLPGGFQYKDEVIEFIPHAEGFVKNDKDGYVYYFNYTDHLGNVRVTYTDDGSGTPYVVEESNYYPFGLKHRGYNEPEQNMKDWGNILTMESSLNHKYKYNGKEFQDELGLNMYDYGARNYDAAIGRWMNIDPLSEVSRRWSPYTYCYNNPIIFTDPDGMYATPPTDLYNLNGDLVRHIEDGKKDKKMILSSLTESAIAGQSDNDVSANLKSGGFGVDVVTVSSNTEITAMDKAFDDTDKDGLERGFVSATDGSISSVDTGTEDEVGLSGELYEIVDSNREPAYDTHSHGVGKITINKDGTFIVEGGAEKSGNDIAGQKKREGEGYFKEASRVLGYDVKVTMKNGVPDINKTRTINFYNGAGNNRTVDYNQYKSAVNKINSQK